MRRFAFVVVLTVVAVLTGGGTVGALDFRLPYPSGVACTVVQAYDTERTHRLTDRYALDFRMREGTLVLAVAEGVVTGVETGWGNTFPRGPVVFGNWVEVDHGGGNRALYAHLREVTVSEGQRVGQGHLLGCSGDSGYSDGGHLHFRLTRVGWPVRPEPMSGYTDFTEGVRYVSDNIAANTDGGRDRTPPSGSIALPRSGWALGDGAETVVIGCFGDNVGVQRVFFFWRYADEPETADRLIGRCDQPAEGRIFSVRWKPYRLEAGRRAVIRAASLDAAGNWNRDVRIRVSSVDRTGGR